MSTQPHAQAARRCPSCGGPAPGPDGESFPFCSERCRLADLGKWLRGDYVVSREIREDDLENPPPIAPRDERAAGG